MTTNASVRYEVLFLTVPGLTNEEATTIETQFRDLVTNNQGKALSYDKWGKYHLAYEIRKNEYGIYFLSRFEIPSVDAGKVLEQFRHFFAVKYSETVMRHLFNHLDMNAPLEYKRPESMEETPARSAREEGRGRDEEGGFERRPRSSGPRRSASDSVAKDTDFEAEESGEEV